MAMAASAFLSSSSSSHPCWTYDVFLSFRGGDTRKNFTDHLYSAFKQAGINTFRDDNELRRGEDIASELSSAIQGSRISVIVFSKNYADSRWCLEELVKIMECRITVRQRVLPIFYDVEPSDVRKQTGSFAQAFLVHEQRYLSGKVLRWREALTEVANLSGLNLADKHEAKFIRQIVEAVSRELNSTYLYVTRYPVGVDCCVQDITSLLRVGANDVRMVGIWGMGGTGKTTISKAIYNHLFHSFDGKSFLVNIRETCKQHDGHVRLQKQLLSDILKTSKIEVNNVDRGIVMIQERLRGKRVLVILDDVEKLEQLNAIAGSRDWFGPGSRIIITTRDEHLLKSLEVDEVYKAKEMSENESLELFSWHAFRNSDPIEEYMHLSRRVVAYSGGLPLALEVLGSFLSTKRNHKYWESALEKLERIPDAQIQEKLKISFDALSDSTEKDIFLDISCFFIGMDKNYVIQILDACGFFPEIGISVLIQRCLLSISEKNKLIMHDLLRDMGREIVRQECPNKPGKCSRLWWHEDAFDILDNHQGTEEVEGLALKFSMLSEVNFSTTEFIKMKRLRLLQLDNVHLTGDYEHLSKELRWLRWHGFPLKFLPNNFYSRKLVAIDLRYSNLTQVWENSKQQFEKLKFLNLGHSHDLRQTPNFARLPNLEKLILKNCTSLFEVHQSIGDLNNLVLVNLKGCRSLESLPKSFYRLKSLQTLILSGCSKFDNLADELGEMESLTTFLADNTAIRQVPCTIVQLKNLKYWSMYGCKGSPRKSPQSVNMLPASLQGLNSLTELNLGYCNLSDDAIPKDLWSLYSLESLNLQNNHFHSLPSSLGGLSKLQSLELDHCTNLRSIPDLPPSLGVLGANDCTMLERVPNISNISTLEILDFTNCKKLVEIPGLNNLLKSMADILLRGCSSLTNTFKQSILQELTLRRDGFRYNIFLPGNDIPDVFMYKNEGPSVCFEMPHNIYGNMEGFTVCIVYSLYPGRIVAHDHPTNSITVINYTKSRTDTESLFFANTHDHEDHMWQASIYNTWFNLEAGDQVKFIVDFGSQINVKKIGVGLIYDKVIDETMIHYASTSNKDAIVVIDDKDQVAIESKRGIGDDKAESSHLLFSSAAELLDLSRDEADRVATILHFAHNINNRNQIDFRSLVTDANIKKYFGYSILKDKPPLKRQSKKFLRKKNIKAEKSKVDKTRVEKAKIGKTKAEEARIEKAKTEKGKVAKRNKPSKATSPRAIATEVLRSDVPASTPGISPSPPSKPSSEAQPCPNVNVLEDPPHKLPTLPESSLVGRSFTGLKGIPNLKELLASVDDDSESSGSDSTREPQVPKKLMGDAIRTGGEGLKGVGLRFKTLATKKHQSMDHGKGKHPITSKRPQYEDMSRKVCNILRSSHESYPRCEVPIPSSFLNISVEATPSQMDAEIHHISDNSEPGRDEREGEGANSRPPTSPQTQNFGRVSPEPRPILETNATKIPLQATEQSAWGVPESVLASSANPASGAVPSIQLPLTSPKGDMKLPIHSLKDGLLGCPLQALQALAPEGYLQGDVGKTTPDRFADILVHHQIAHAVKLAVLYQEYRDHQSKYPQELAQMRTQLKSLDFEVAKLKPYEVEVGRLWELPAAKEVELTESQRARTSAETKVADYDNLTSQLTEKTEECSLLYAQQEKIDAKLTKKLEECIFLRTQIDETETRLADAEIQCSDLQAKLTTIGTQKDETEARLVDTEIQFSQLQAKLSAVETQLLVERKEAYENFNVVIHELKETKGKYFKLRKRYHHYKGKAIRFLKQLSLTTWYRDHSWARGFHWGFESFRTIASNPSIFKVDFKTVSADYLPPPEQATEELHDLGKDLFPDVPRWTNDQADYPEDPSLPSVPIDDSDSDSDNYAPDA